MSATTSEAAALPVTGSGPFTLAIGLIGLASIGVGALLRRMVGRDAGRPSRSVPAGRFDLSADLSNDLTSVQR